MDKYVPLSPSPTKRQRTNDIKQEVLLTCVSVVTRCNLQLFSCQDLCTRIEVFVDGPDRWADWDNYKSFISTSAAARVLDKAMQCAASRGLLHILCWLHMYFPIRIGREVVVSRTVMNKAASNGHIQVLEFLHEHRSEGCSTEAMDLAALNGRLNVCRWLHKNRSEGCSTTAFHGSMCLEDPKLLRFLYEYYPDQASETIQDTMNLNLNDEELKAWMSAYNNNLPRVCFFEAFPELCEDEMVAASRSMAGVDWTALETQIDSDQDL